MSGVMSIAIQCEREEHIALGGSAVEHSSKGGESANPNCLGSACEEA